MNRIIESAIVMEATPTPRAAGALSLSSFAAAASTLATRSLSWSVFGPAAQYCFRKAHFVCEASMRP